MAGISVEIHAQTTVQSSTQTGIESTQTGSGRESAHTTNQQIKNTIRAVEQRDDLDNKTIYTNVSHSRIMSLLER